MLLILSASGGYSVAGFPKAFPKALPTFARSFDDFAKLDLSYGPMQDLSHLTTFGRPSVKKCANR